MNNVDWFLVAFVNEDRRSMACSNSAQFERVSEERIGVHHYLIAGSAAVGPVRPRCVYLASLMRAPPCKHRFSHSQLCNPL